MSEIGYEELARVALAYVLEDEAWAAFASWALTSEHSPALHDYLDAADALDHSRLLWLSKTPDLGTGLRLDEAGQRARDLLP